MAADMGLEGALTAPGEPPAPPMAYTRELGEAVCRRIAAGESVSDIATDPAMPGGAAIYGWIRRHAEFAEMTFHAFRVQAHRKFELAWEIARAATPEMVAVARLQIATLKWQAARLAPQIYAEGVKPPPEPVTVKIRRWGVKGWADLEQPELAAATSGDLGEWN